MTMRAQRQQFIDLCALRLSAQGGPISVRDAFAELADIGLLVEEHAPSIPMFHRPWSRPVC